MQALKELSVAFTVGLSTLLIFSLLKDDIIPVERHQEQDIPTVITGEPEESAPPFATLAGKPEIVVAIIDTGADIHHPALSQSIWRNPGEQGRDKNGNNKATNGKDDDDNGFVDDLHGWNFVADSPEVTDDHGHGTHIAGIIGARKLNGRGFNGVAPGVSLMILKYYDTENAGPDNLRYTIAAIRYAVTMGAKIINYSGGGVLKSEEEQETLKWANQQGVLVIAAAGNEGMNSDFFHFYPADYDLPNILSVAAIDRHGELIQASNHGLNTVDIAAPGRNIYSTLPGGEYGFMTGTSQATAYVTGAAALVMSEDSRLEDPAEVLETLIQSSRPVASLKNKVRSGGRLDVATALASSRIQLAAWPKKRQPAQNTN